MWRGGKLLATIDTTGGTKHVVADHLGSSRCLMDRCGSCVAQHKFLPFGEEATGSADDGERMRFTGHERDLKNPANATDDLDYMHAHFYNPNLARLISVDPVGGPRASTVVEWVCVCDE